jgi:MarR family 2-MHQ and catechol resistance regulon transcriptional repressor
MTLKELIWLGQRLVDTGRLDAQARARGVPTAQYTVMRSLLEQSPATITELAGRTGYAQSRVSTAVTGLVERGWAETSSDPTDGRRRLVSVPVRIRQSVEKIEAGTETRTLEHLLADRSPERRQTIIDALEELLDVFREREATG